jgi:uncharacterized damage-inducible protein DinB
MAESSIVQSSLVNYYRMIQRRVRELADPLSSEQLWVRPYPYGNSIGNLILHLTGNLSYYIGAQIGGTGYVRQRPLEFSSTGKPKDEVLRQFDQAIETVIATIGKQSDDDWAAPFYGELESESKNRFSAFLACAGHAYHHVGQMIYLQRELLGTALGS